MQTPDFLLSCLNSPILRNIKTTMLLVPIAVIDCCVYAPRTNINATWSHIRVTYFNT